MSSNQHPITQTTKSGTDTTYKQKTETTTKRVNGDLFDAEALGNLHTLKHTRKEQPIESRDLPDVIDNAADLNMAIARAQLEFRRNKTDMGHIVVSQRLMDAISAGDPDTKSVTYGNPGVRLYIDGAKEEMDKRESMSAEAYHDWLVRSKR